MNEKKVALALGSFAALFHLVWGILIAIGMAQPVLNFVYNLHSLNNPFVVMAFDPMKTLGLIIFTFIMGYIFGYVFAMLWNKFHK